MVEPKPVKQSVAVLVRAGDEILTLRRPEDEEELPGIWGLPAGSYRPGETLDDLVERIGREKLGVRLEPAGVLASGSQERPRYVLQMQLIEACMEGLPTRCQWRWARLGVLEEGRRRGSLCCDLALGSGQ